MRDALTSRRIAVSIVVISTATILGALASEHLFGLLPCKLCRWQRWPYYLGVPLAFFVALAPPGLLRPGLWLLTLVFLASAGLAAYHAGVEWGLFAGPSDCAAAGGSAAAQVGDFLKSLETTRVVSCTEAAWRFLGLSLAGWNTLVSLALAGLALRGAVRASPAQGSSSVSQ